MTIVLSVVIPVTIAILGGILTCFKDRFWAWFDQRTRRNQPKSSPDDQRQAQAAYPSAKASVDGNSQLEVVQLNDLNADSPAHTGGANVVAHGSVRNESGATDIVVDGSIREEGDAVHEGASSHESAHPAGSTIIQSSDDDGRPQNIWSVSSLLNTAWTMISTSAYWQDGSVAAQEASDGE